MLSKEAAIAANRFGLGARPGDAGLIGRDGIGWLEAQLEAAARTPRSPAQPIGQTPRSAVVLQQIRDLKLTRQIARRAESEAPTRRRDAPPPTEPAKPAPVDRDAVREFGQFVRDQYLDQVNARQRRAVTTDEPFIERLVQFWSNHFAVSADKQPIGALAGLYEQEAIAPHVTGNFLELLTAVEKHPAMILYLDNQASMGPDSTAAKLARRNRGRELGPNENLAREILELHTLGVDGGYGQQDVTEFARVLTGWSIGGTLGQRALGRGSPGEFYFGPFMHEPGEKTVLGKRYGESGIGEGEAVLETLAMHPATAQHIALKLARHFVADEPPAPLVEQLATTYLDADGELAPVYRALIRSKESWHAPLAKYKTPQDFVISTYRALDQPPANPQRVTAFLIELGQRPFTPGSPAGWPDTAASWDSGDALLKRIEWGTAVGRAIGDRVDPAPLADAILAPNLSRETLAGIERAESAAQALALLLAAPEFQRR